MKYFEVWYQAAKDGKPARYVLLNEKQADHGLLFAKAGGQRIHDFMAPGQNEADRIFAKTEEHHRKKMAGLLAPLPFRRRR